jgi:Holliday junction resolvase
MSKGGRRSRDKGARTERGIVNALQAAGFAAVRVPLSGAVGGRFGGDVVLPVNGRELRCEVKCRGDGFRKLYAWLADHDVLIVKADRQEPLVILRLSRAAELASAAIDAKTNKRTIPMNRSHAPTVAGHAHFGFGREYRA